MGRFAGYGAVMLCVGLGLAACGDDGGDSREAADSQEVPTTQNAPNTRQGCAEFRVVLDDLDFAAPRDVFLADLRTFTEAARNGDDALAGMAEEYRAAFLHLIDWVDQQISSGESLDEIAGLVVGIEPDEVARSTAADLTNAELDLRATCDFGDPVRSWWDLFPEP